MRIVIYNFNRFTSVLLSFFFVIIMFGCQQKKFDQVSEIKISNDSRVIFKIDERTEFFRTIFNIAVQDDLNENSQPCETEYLERVNSHFLPFKNHPIIHWVYDDENIGIDFSAIGLMYYDLENFEFNTIYEKELKSIGLSKAVLDSVKPLMIDFYQKSEFDKFFKANKDYYSQAITKIEGQVSKEKIFDKVMNFYQENNSKMQLNVFVELTNNSNNRALSFYENYSSTQRAYILGNFCERPNQSNNQNDILELDNDIRGILFHETSHLFTDKFLNKYIGDLNQYLSICQDCNELQIRDKVDHLIVRPLQAIMMKKFDNNISGHNYYMNKSKDIGKDVYMRLSRYNPDKEIPFENVYIDCINLIKESAQKMRISINE